MYTYIHTLNGVQGAVNVPVDINIYEYSDNSVLIILETHTGLRVACVSRGSLKRESIWEKEQKKKAT